MRRASCRKVNILRKRSDYADSLAKRSLFTQVNRECKGFSGHHQTKPQRAARAALRTFLAKDAIETISDLPAISMGRPGHRKPSVSPMFMYQYRPIWPEFIILTEMEGVNILQECITTASEGEGDIQEHVESDSCETTSSHQNTCDDGSQTGLETEAKESRCNMCSGKEIELSTQVHDLSKEVVGSDQRTCDSDREGIEEAAADGQCSLGESGGASRREAILRDVAAKLQQRARDAEAAAAAAKARESEARALAKTNTARHKCTRKDIKQVLQLEKQRAAALRKRRNQAAHVQSLTDKAARSLQEACEIREQAEAEAFAARARLVAQATEAAQSEAAMQARAEISKAQEEAEALKEEGLQAKDEMEAQVQAEVNARKASAERDIQEMKQLASEQMQAQADAIVQAAQAMAEQNARAVREKALADALSLKARVEAQMLAKAAADERARLAAVKLLRVETEAKVLKETEFQAHFAVKKVETQKMCEDAVGLKQAKELEKQRACKFRKQAQMERKLQQQKQEELVAIRSQAMKEAEESKEQALAEAAKLKARAHADAHAIRARAQVEAQAKAKAEAAQKIQAAEVEAEAIKANAEQEAQEIRSELVRESIHVQAQLGVLREHVQSVSVVPAEPSADTAEDKDTDDWEVLPTAYLQPLSGVSGWDLVA